MKNLRWILVMTMCFYTGSATAQRLLSLEDCREMVLVNSIAERNSSLEQKIAIGNRKAARTQYFPALSATALGFASRKAMMEITSHGGDLPVYDGDPAHLPDATQYAYFPSSTMAMMKEGWVGSISVVQPLYVGGRIRAGNALADLGVEVSELQQRLQRNRTLIVTEEKYWQWVSLTEKRLTLIRYAELLDGLVMQAEGGYRSGLVTRNDLMKVQLKQSEIQRNMAILNHGLDLARMDFCRHIGIPYDSTVVLIDTLSVVDAPEIYRVDHQSALGARPEHSLLQASVQVEELQTKMKRGEYLPQIAVGVNGLAMKMDKADTRTIGMVFGTVQIPISSWWEASYALQNHVLKEEIARNTLKENSDLLILQMEKSWREVIDAWTLVRLTDAGRIQAEENHRINRDGYENGIVTITDVLEAQALLQESRDHFTDARMAYRIAVTTYLQQTGR